MAKALRLDAWNPRDIEVVGEGAATGVALHGALAELGVQVDISMTHSRGDRGRGRDGALRVTAGAAPLPDWLEPLFGAEQMRAIDRWAIEERGIPSLDLMERAAAGLTVHTDRLVPRGPIAIVCGKGNNGGDGLAAGRMLRGFGRTVRVLLLAAPDEYTRRRGREPAPPRGGARAVCRARARRTRRSSIDAILGTGFEGEPRGAAIAAIEAIATFDGPVVAADIASGVDASTGEAARVSVVATATVTFAAAKPGHWIAPGKQAAGERIVVDIGIPPGAPVAARRGPADRARPRARARTRRGRRRSSAPATSSSPAARAG